MNIFPHFLYGPGEDALALTEEYGAKMDENYTQNIFEDEKNKKLCRDDGNCIEIGYCGQLMTFLSIFALLSQPNLDLW